ncbi:MAG: NAD-dependent epimerase/dehydratase family protein [Solirubrobacterales bacterium]
MDKTILITGAGGFLGRCFASRLAAARPDLKIIAAERPAAPAWELPAGVEMIRFDVTEPIEIKAQPAVIFHIAGEKLDESRMDSVNRGGTASLLAWARSAGVRRFIYLSSVGIYGATYNSGVITEASPAKPRNRYEQSKYEAENLVRSAGESGGLETVILRPSNVFGRMDQGELPLLNMIRMVRKGWFTYIGESATCFNYIAVEDVADALIAALQKEAGGRDYILNTPVLLRDAVYIIASELGLPAPARTLPVWSGKLGGEIAAGLSALTGRNLPFNRERFRELTNTTCFDGTRITRELNFDYPTGVLPALRELTRFYRVTGLL